MSGEGGSGSARLLDQLLLERYEPIAIVGVGLRFPGGNDTPEGFAAFLRAGGRGTGPIPADRWDVDGLASTDPAERGKVRTAGGGFLTGIDQFDARFFNISPKEAQYIDPQQRLVLETAWAALEDANLDPTGLRHGNGGVFMGISANDFGSAVSELSLAELDPHVGTGIAYSALSGRLSYFLGWRGPSISVDTACSSSLVALHLAAEGLRRGECDIALCGGVNAIHDPRNHVIFSQANMLAPDGRCKTFDDAADGYSRSEGCGVVVLKRLSDARRAGDRIVALVRGVAVGQDGESGGLTVPNGASQQAVMRAALAAAMLEPGDIQYVEAHGTGTPLGDPIELGAIHAVFAGSHTPASPVVVASVKTNIGHMEAAAGIGGVIKTALALRDAVIYPHLNFQNPSRHVPWDRYAVTVPTGPRPWPAGTRRALVNSFGFAGTIATAVLEQPPDPPAVPAAGRPAHDGQVFTVSAKTPAALTGLVERYARHLAERPDADVADVCYTANTGRAHLPLRLAGAVRTRADLADLLDGWGSAAAPEPAGPRQVALLFTGQGAQYPGMGRPLYERYPVFRDLVDECDELFQVPLGRSVRALLLDPDAGDVDQTRYTQPALFTFEYALARLWQSFGVRPAVLLGHSIGEVAAAAVAGLFPLADAVTLVAARGAVMQSVRAPGGMLSVPAPAADIAALLAEYPDLAVAAINAPELCVVSGGRASLDRLGAALAERGLRTRELAVSHAFHSPLMAEVTERFRAAIAGLTFHEPTMTLVSNVTGAPVRLAEIGTPDYWVRHIMAPVDFAAGMRAVAQRGRHAFVEVGPAATLLGLGRRCVPAGDHDWLPSREREDPDGTVLLRSLARLYAAGVDISWTGFHRGRPGRRTALPTYPFDRRRYWLPAPVRGRGAPGPGHPLLGTEVSTPEQRAAGVREYAGPVAADRPGYLADHLVHGQVVFPAAGYLELLLAAQHAAYGETRRPLADLHIREPLLLPSGEPGEYAPVELRVRLAPGTDGEVEAQVLSRVGDGPERLHATARLVSSDPAGAEPVWSEPDGVPDAELSPADVYADLAELGLDYGPAFQRVRRLRRYGRRALGELRGDPVPGAEHLPTSLLDAAFHSSTIVLGTRDTYLPVHVERCQLFREPRGESLRSVFHLVAGDAGADELTGDVTLFDGDRPVFALRRLRLRRITAPGSGRGRLFHEPRWVRRPPARSAGPEPRHILLIGVPEQARAGFVARPGTTLTFDTVPAGEQPTDVCWHWRYGGGDLSAECERNYRDLLELLANFDANFDATFAGAPTAPRLWLVTVGAHLLPGEPAGPPDPVRLAAATLTGFAASLRTEYPAYRVTVLDLPPGGEPGGYACLLDEVLTADPDEPLVAYRSGLRHVRRIHPADPAGGPAPDEGNDGENVELAVAEYGEFSGIRPVPVPDPEPVGDEIRVRVHAAGLNFKDVINALGLLRQHAEAAGQEYRPQPLGFEAAGTVVAAGPHAAHPVGTAVMISHLGCLRRRVTVPSAAAVAKPARLTFAEAAAVPAAFITAYHALHDLAGIRPGDRVLIHAAAGGVGQAALQLARLAGAEVYATASPAKWPLLREQGVADVFNSRTPDFAEALLAATGDGVDIVLNSLNGEYIPAGLRVLRSGGRFVELGKLGIWSPERVRAVRPDVGYHSFDLSELPAEELTALNHRILSTVAELLERGALTPPPCTGYGPDEVAEAFGVLSRGANTGKLVLTMVDEPPAPAEPVTLSPDETYLITGGLGALGLVTARQLADLGARHLALVSRRPVGQEAIAALAARVGPAGSVAVHLADVAEPDDVARLLTELRAGAHPVGGIVHAAGLVADGLVAGMTWPQLDTVFRAKVYGSWLLHEAARALPGLRFFVGYSSISAVLGPGGQANYAAGNAFLDALMHWRRGTGAPGLSLNWGPWAGAGLAAGLGEQHLRAIQGQGIRLLRSVQGARAFGQALSAGHGQLMVGEVDWDRYLAGRSPANAQFRYLAGRVDRSASRVDLAALRALPDAERRTTVNALIRARIADLLHFGGADELAPDAKFAELGLDSLVAVELKNSLEAAFGVPLAVGAVYDHPTIDELAGHLCEQLEGP